MKKNSFIILTLFTSLLSFAFSEPRNALLIANGNYKAFGSLATPIKEARELKETLEKLDFKVTILENGSLEKMQDAVDDFGNLLNKQGGIGFFHYGGHAVQVNGANYLIPVDADIPDEKRCKLKQKNFFLHERKISAERTKKLNSRLKNQKSQTCMSLRWE